MKTEYLKDLTNKELDRMHDIMCEAHQIMKDVIARTGEDRFGNEMYTLTMMTSISTFQEIQKRFLNNKKNGNI